MRYYIAVAIASFVFLVSGAAKLESPYVAAEALRERFDLATIAQGHNLVHSLAGFEIVVGAGLILPWVRGQALGFAWSAVVAFAVATVADGFAGRIGDCGCFGSLQLLNSYGARVAALVLSISSLCVATRRLEGSS